MSGKGKGKGSKQIELVYKPATAAKKGGKRKPAQTIADEESGAEEVPTKPSSPKKKLRPPPDESSSSGEERSASDEEEEEFEEASDKDDEQLSSDDNVEGEGEGEVDAGAAAAIQVVEYAQVRKALKDLEAGGVTDSYITLPVRRFGAAPPSGAIRVPASFFRARFWKEFMRPLFERERVLAQAPVFSEKPKAYQLPTVIVSVPNRCAGASFALHADKTEDCNVDCRDEDFVYPCKLECRRFAMRPWLSPERSANQLFVSMGDHWRTASGFEMCGGYVDPIAALGVLKAGQLKALKKLYEHRGAVPFFGVRVDSDVLTELADGLSAISARMDELAACQSLQDAFALKLVKQNRMSEYMMSTSGALLHGAGSQVYILSEHMRLPLASLVLKKIDGDAVHPVLGVALYNLQPLMLVEEEWMTAAFTDNLTLLPHSVQDPLIKQKKALSASLPFLFPHFQTFYAHSWETYVPTFRRRRPGDTPSEEKTFRVETGLQRTHRFWVCGVFLTEIVLSKMCKDALSFDPKSNEASLLKTAFVTLKRMGTRFRTLQFPESLFRAKLALSKDRAAFELVELDEDRVERQTPDVKNTKKRRASADAPSRAAGDSPDQLAMKSRLNLLNYGEEYEQELADCIERGFDAVAYASYLFKKINGKLKSETTKNWLHKARAVLKYGYDKKALRDAPSTSTAAPEAESKRPRASMFGAMIKIDEASDEEE